MGETVRMLTAKQENGLADLERCIPYSDHQLEE